MNNHIVCRCIKEWDLRKNFSISNSDAVPKVTITYPGMSKRRLGKYCINGPECLLVFYLLGVCLILIKRYQIKGVCYTLIKRWLVSLIFQVIPTLYLIQVTASSLPTVGMMSYINLMSSTTAPNQVKYAFNSLNSNFSLVK